MPEKVIAHTEAAQHKRAQFNIGSVFSLSQEQPDNSHNIDKIEEVSRLLKEHAFHFFLHEGGKAEDWDEGEEQHITHELAKRWKLSEWGQLWTHRHHRRKKEFQGIGGHQWFGTSFEVGTLMGVNVLHLRGKEHPMNPCLNPARDEVDEGSSEARLGAPSTTQVNAEPILSNKITTVETPTTSKTALLSPRRSRTLPLENDKRLLPSNDRRVASDYILRPAVYTDISKASAMSDGQLLSNAKGKAKAVQSAEHLGTGPSSQSPVPPEEVLQMTKSTVDANASPASIAVQGPIWGDVILRGIFNCFSIQIFIRIDFIERQNVSEGELFQIRRVHKFRRLHT